MLRTLSACIAALALAGGAAPAADQNSHSGNPLLELYYRVYPKQKIVRSKNVSSVTTPSDGIYCVTPMIALPRSIYPQLTEVWDPSSLAGSVTWQDPASDCNPGDIEVWTLYGGGLSRSINFVLTVSD